MFNMFTHAVSTLFSLLFSSRPTTMAGLSRWPSKEVQLSKDVGGAYISTDGHIAPRCSYRKDIPFRYLRVSLQPNVAHGVPAARPLRIDLPKARSPLLRDGVSKRPVDSSSVGSGGGSAGIRHVAAAPGLAFREWTMSKRADLHLHGNSLGDRNVIQEREIPILRSRKQTTATGAVFRQSQSSNVQSYLSVSDHLAQCMQYPSFPSLVGISEAARHCYPDRPGGMRLRSLGNVESAIAVVPQFPV